MAFSPLPHTRPYGQYHIRVILILAALVFSMGGFLPEAHAQTRPTLPFGEPVTGVLNQDGTGSMWALNGMEGTMILIDMRADDPALMDPFLTLVGPDGSQLALDDDSGPGLDARIGPVFLPESGEYTVVTGSYRGTGGYQLEAIDLADVPTIAQNKPLVGTVGPEHRTDYFILDSRDFAPENLFRLALDGSSGNSASDPDDGAAGPLLTLYPPDGNPISTEYTGGNALDPLAPVPDSRTVIAVDWSPDSDAAAYTLVLGPSQISLLAPGVVQRGKFSWGAHIERHFLRAASGDMVRLRLTRTDGDIAPALRVLTADFSHALFTSEGPSVIETSVVLAFPASGIYVVEVGEGTAQSSPGAYSLSAEWLEQD